MLTQREAAARVMEHIIAHDDAHGYSQPNRMGDGTTEQVDLGDDVTVSIHGGDYDCSEAVRMCLSAVGVDDGDWMWTGNEDSILTGCGFVRHVLADDDYQPRRGDPILRSGHTEMMLSDDTSGGARWSYYGNGLDGPQGDQNGLEITSGPFDRSRWLYAYEWPGGDGETIGEDMSYDEVHTNACNGQQNVRGIDQVDYIDDRVLGLNNIWCGTHDNVCNGQQGIQTRDQIDYIDERVTEILATVSAQSAAIEALSKAQGADPAAIAKSVSDAVAAKLATIKLDVTTS